MKYKIGDVLYSKYDGKKQKGRVVLDTMEKRGAYNMPMYKFCSDDSQFGFVWVAEWMLCTEEEFISSVKSGTLLALELDN